MEGHPECFANIPMLLYFGGAGTSGSQKTCHQRECFAKKTRENVGVPPLSVVSEPGDIGSENAEILYDSSTWFFFVTKTGAARWLALDGLAELSEIADYNYLLRGEDCCTSCAVSQVTTHSLVLL